MILFLVVRRGGLVGAGANGGDICSIYADITQVSVVHTIQFRGVPIQSYPNPERLYQHGIKCQKYSAPGPGNRRNSRRNIGGMVFGSDHLLYSRFSRL